MPLPQVVRRCVAQSEGLLLWGYKGPGFESPGGLLRLAHHVAFNACGLFSNSSEVYIRSKTVLCAWTPSIAA